MTKINKCLFLPFAISFLLTFTSLAGAIHPNHLYDYGNVMQLNINSIVTDKDNSLIKITYAPTHSVSNGWFNSGGGSVGSLHFLIDGHQVNSIAVEDALSLSSGNLAISNNAQYNKFEQIYFPNSSAKYYYIKHPVTNEILGYVNTNSNKQTGINTITLRLNGTASLHITGLWICEIVDCASKHSDGGTCERPVYVLHPSCSTIDIGSYISSMVHTHNTNSVHYDNSGSQVNNGFAQHYVHKWYSCDANDGYTKDGDYYWENCYDRDDNGYCDFCGRKRVWVNINVNTPEGNEDTSGGTAKFDVSWYENTTFGGTQNHWAGQVSDQPIGKAWVGTQIWIANINMQKNYLYLTEVNGTTKSGNGYYYTVQDTSNYSININTDYKSYTLTINPNGGTLNVTDGSITKNSNGTAKATVKYNHDWYYSLGVTASRSHYIMDGFYTATSGGTKLWDNGGNCYNGNAYWNSSNKWCYAGDVTVYAHWKDAPGYHNGQPIVYTITYNLFPKNGSGVKITNPGNPTTYTIETPTFTLKNPSANNYSFEGWYGSGTKGSKGVTIVQGSIGDLHFTADWVPTKDTNKSSGKDQNLPYVKTTDIIENNYKLAS